MKTNRRLTQDKADWLAQYWSRQEADGRWHILGHPAHKITSAQLYRLDEVLPVLGVAGAVLRLLAHQSDQPFGGDRTWID